MDTIKEESAVLQPGKEGAEMITVGGPNDVIHSENLVLIDKQQNGFVVITREQAKRNKSINKGYQKNCKMKTKLIIFLIIGLMFLGNIAKAEPDPPLDGKSIFTSRCAACHNVNKILTGPALAGVDERRSIDWIINFVHSSQTMVKKGDKDAVAIYEKFNKIPMPDHPDLSADNIKSIVEYIKSESKPVGEEKASFTKSGKKQTGYTSLTSTDYWLFGGLLGAVVLLILVLIFAAKVKKMQRNRFPDTEEQ